MAEKKQTSGPAKKKTRAQNKSGVARKKQKAGSESTCLRIRVRAYEYKVLDLSVQQIIDTALRYEVEVRGPVPLPTEIKKYTVNRSSFIYSKSREQFEMRIHKRLIDILNPNQKVIESLTNINLPSGVSIDIKMV